VEVEFLTEGLKSILKVRDSVYESADFFKLFCSFHSSDYVIFFNVAIEEIDQEVFMLGDRQWGKQVSNFGQRIS